MLFEYQINPYDSRYPNLVISVAEVLKAKGDSETAYRERVLFDFCLRAYSKECGNRISLPSVPFSALCNKLGKKGKLVISRVETEDVPQYIWQVVTDEGPKALDVDYASFG